MRKKIKIKRKFKRLFKLFLFIVLIISIIFIIKSFIKKEPSIILSSEERKYNSIINNINESNSSYNNEIKQSADKTIEIDVNNSLDNYIKNFMNVYYLSLKRLKPFDMTVFFSENSYENSYLNQQSLRLLINMRKQQLTDLRMNKYSFELDYNESYIKDGIINVSFKENNAINFKSLNDITSKSYNIKNNITLVKENNLFKVVSYTRFEDAFNAMDKEYVKSESEEEELIKNNVINLYDKLYSDFLTNFEIMKEDNALFNSEEYVNPSKQCDNSYNRDKAYNYAMKWTINRNPDWTKYDDYGGNCQNYASQVLIAGGIPMDNTYPGIWKWYGHTPNNSSSKTGRSASWTVVDYFYEYAKNNTGTGLCALVDQNIYSSEKGDIIQVTTEENSFQHTIVVVGIVKKDDKVLDILTNSNTADRENYPLSAYNFSKKRLIKVLGYNN